MGQQEREAQETGCIELIRSEKFKDPKTLYEKVDGQGEARTVYKDSKS